MSFSVNTVENLLVACGRRCCVCREMKGVKIEVHHIVPKGEGGDDTPDNAITLCFDCHAEIGHYNVKHPRGRKYTPHELRRHRDQLIGLMKQPPLWDRPSVVLDSEASALNVDELTGVITQTEMWQSDQAAKLYPRILALDQGGRRSLVAALDRLLESEDNDVCWSVAAVIEFLVQWGPTLVPDDLLLRMSNHRTFSVRSSAAVAYYWLTMSSPERVPAEVVGRLASFDEDWYVMTPATSALVRLARTRPVAIDLLSRQLQSADADTRHHAATALRRVGRQWPSAYRDDVADLMLESPDESVRAVGQEWKAGLAARQGAEDRPLDSYMF